MISGIPAGNYTVTVTDAKGCTFQASYYISQPVALSSYFRKMNVKCNGGSDGFARIFVSGGTTPYTYLWSTGATTVSINGRTAGMYTVTVTDANGCQANTSISITQPTLLTVDAGNDATVYYGYLPLSCATLNATSTGGTGSVSYSWSNGSNSSSTSVCPSTNTTYTITVTDANGCTATDEVSICVVNAICFAGNSSIQKVEMCHNGNTICIPANAVASHLAHGCTIGSCSEQNQCENRSFTQTSSSTHLEGLNVYPNPTNGIITISLHNENSTFAHATIFNSIGDVVMSLELKDGDNMIDCNSFSNGIYFIQTQDQSIKFIKN
jgi:hypothetical protein